MRLIANDICTRAALTRLLIKMEDDPELNRKVGIEDTSRFKSEAGQDKKEGKENVELVLGHFDHSRSL